MRNFNFCKVDVFLKMDKHFEKKNFPFFCLWSKALIVPCLSLTENIIIIITEIIRSTYIYSVSRKKLYLILEGQSTPKFWARNISRGCFGILWFSAFQNCPYFWLVAQLKLRYLRLKIPGVTFRMNTLCNCNTKILYPTMTPGVFNLK